VINQKHVDHACPEGLIRKFHLLGLSSHGCELLEVGNIDEAGTDYLVEDTPDLFVFKIHQLADLMDVFY
jgi:hypothetical protein